MLRLFIIDSLISVFGLQGLPTINKDSDNFPANPGLIVDERLTHPNILVTVTFKDEWIELDR